MPFLCFQPGGWSSTSAPDLGPALRRQPPPLLPSVRSRLGNEVHPHQHDGLIVGDIDSVRLVPVATMPLPPLLDGRIALVLRRGELPGHVAERGDVDAVDLDEPDRPQVVVDEDEPLPGCSSSSPSAS